MQIGAEQVLREGEIMLSYNSVDEALDELKRGRIIMVSDDEDRENEGDLICAAQFATQENVNFMAVHAKGLICMPMSSLHISRLGLTPMTLNNTDNHETAFTVSVDHISTTTGISAKERSVTAIKCAEDNAKPSDFRRPGHMFPLEAKAGGVFERSGHTEATVDLMRLAGLKEIGLCCEIMSDDGDMMKKEELAAFAQKHNLKYITIKQIQEYRRIYDIMIKREAKAKLPTSHGEFDIYGYQNIINGNHHVALVMGDVKDKNVLCRIHSECLTGDVFGSHRCDCGQQLHAALDMINKEQCGILIYMRQEGRGIGLINKLKAYELQENGYDTVDANIHLGFAPDLRDYAETAQILKDLGVKGIRLLTNNPHKIENIEDYGIKVTERVAIQVEENKDDIKYLLTKKHRMGHLLTYDDNKERNDV